MMAESFIVQVHTTGGRLLVQKTRTTGCSWISEKSRELEESVCISIGTVAGWSLLPVMTLRSGAATIRRKFRGAKKSPASPVAGINNQVTFEPVTTSKLRITFLPRGKQPDKGKVGLSEIEVWEQ